MLVGRQYFGEFAIFQEYVDNSCGVPGAERAGVLEEVVLMVVISCPLIIITPNLHLNSDPFPAEGVHSSLLYSV